MEPPCKTFLYRRFNFESSVVFACYAILRISITYKKEGGQQNAFPLFTYARAFRHSIFIDAIVIGNIEPFTAGSKSTLEIEVFLSLNKSPAITSI